MAMPVPVGPGRAVGMLHSAQPGLEAADRGCQGEGEGAMANPVLGRGDVAGAQPGRGDQVGLCVGTSTTGAAEPGLPSPSAAGLHWEQRLWGGAWLV